MLTLQHTGLFHQALLVTKKATEETGPYWASELDLLWYFTVWRLGACQGVSERRLWHECALQGPVLGRVGARGGSGDHAGSKGPQVKSEAMQGKGQAPGVTSQGSTSFTGPQTSLWSF